MQKLGERSVEVFYEDGGQPKLAISMKPRDLVVPIKVPVTVYGHRVSHGKLGMRFMKYRQNPWDRAYKTLQLTLTCEDIEGLKRIHGCIIKQLTASPLENESHGSKSLKTKYGQVSRAFFKPLMPSNVCQTVSPIRNRVVDAYSKRYDKGQPVKEELPSLSAEQMHVFDLVVNKGRSIFFTGSAGTGKSLLLKHIIKALPSSTTFITGTTGLAGCLLGGTTINAFAGIGKGDGDIDAMLRSASRGDALFRWRQAKVLIIDEISMMDGALFDKLESISRAIRQSKDAFGGIQLVLAGDYHQLPPVSRNSATRKFCFEAHSWGSCVQNSIELKTVFRQSDSDFIDILGRIRAGTVAQHEIPQLLGQCFRPLNVDDGILPTQLFTHRADVEALNLRELESLKGDMVTYSAHDSGDSALLDGSCPAPRKLQLKIGAQVMLTRNISSRQGLVNGARGIVEKISSSGLPYVRFASSQSDIECIPIEREKWSISSGGVVIAQRSQLPLTLAWGITVHKSQGMSLDRVEISLEKAFECGMAYVALSRSKSMDGLRIKGSISRQSLQADTKVLSFYSKF